MTKSSMEYRRLGTCGMKVSAFGLGGWTTYGGSIAEADKIRAILGAAFDAGINFFDIADVYAKGESEKAMGAVLRDFPRHELVISSKVFFPMSDDVNDRGLSRKHVCESIEKTLRRIGTEYLDIYFCHRHDDATPVEETARAMDDLIHQGKVLYWGTSEWTGDQLRGVRGVCDSLNLYAPQIEQPQYSLLVRDKFEHDIRPAVEDLGMGTVIWSPLASGLLTGKYDDGVPADSRLGQIDWLREDWMKDQNMARTKALAPIAQEVGVSRSQLALAWAVQQPAVSSVILGATNVKQLHENLAALDTKLPADVLAAMDKVCPADGRRG